MKYTKNRYFAIFLAILVTFSLLSFDFKVEASEDRAAQLEKIGKIIDYAKENYYREVDEDEIIDFLLKSTLSVLDDYSYYMNPEDAQKFIEDIDGNFYGVGVQIRKEDKYIRVTKVLPDTPAQKVGILANDLIISVDDVDVEALPLDKAVSMIRGEKGTKVKLQIRRESAGSILNFHVMRDEIKTISVEFSKKEGIGILKLNEFSLNAFEQFKKIMEENKGMKAMVIDLRGNPGGLLNTAISISDAFLPEGKIITIAKYKGKEPEIKKSGAQMYDMKLAVLIDENSASASEILAGALKDNGRALIIGKKSFGKGTIQAFSDVLKDGSLVKLTIGEYLLPKNESINKVGIVPDIVVDESQIHRELYPINSLNVSKYGSYDIDTYGMQQRLNLLGYSLKVDGRFGKQSEKALIDWQKKNGLNATGILDIDSKIKLMNMADKLYLKQNDIVLERAIAELKK